MFTFEKSIFINRPPQEVFDYITNPDNDSNWRSTAVSAEWTSDGPVGVGSTQRTVGKFLGRKIDSTNEVTVWDPPNQFAFKSVGGSIPLEISQKLVAKDNGTQLTIDAQAELGGFFKLAEGLVGKQAEKQMDTDFNALKLVLEAG
jgi:carbon monoxide dehydrogenase subunit G